MNKLAVPLLCLAAAYAFLFGYVAISYPQLPPKVASHFDLHGNPDGWMSRASSTEIMLAVAILAPGIVVVTMAGAGRIPISFINLPHRDYWLAPERRTAALDVLRRYGLWFATLNVLFLTGLQALTVDANLQPPPHQLNMQHLLIGAILYLALTVLWTIRLLRHFAKV
jgi:uncharacterized membrane protein